MSQRLKEALRRRREEEHEVAAALKADYPPGAKIRWKIGEHHADGEVTMNCYGDRIKVRNIRTGRERFIHAYDVDA